MLNLIIILTAQATKDGLKLIKEYEQKGNKILNHFIWGQLSGVSRGIDLPCVIESDNGPSDYSSVFRISDYLKITKKSGFVKLFKYCNEDPYLKEYFSIKNNNTEDISSCIWIIIGYLLDRYVHIYNTNNFHLNKFKEIYLPIENGIYFDILRFSERI